MGGHHERIGAFDPAYVDSAFDETYPSGHFALEKINAIDGATGEVLQWDPDLQSLRGVDAVRIIPTPSNSQVAFGGAFPDVDREEGVSPGLALYDFGRPR